MLITCYRSRLWPLCEQDDLSVFVQQVGGWMRIRADYSVDYYVPEEWAYMMYIYDTDIERKHKMDMIA
jgi:hypothetical protein